MNFLDLIRKLFNMINKKEDVNQKLVEIPTVIFKPLRQIIMPEINVNHALDWEGVCIHNSATNDNKTSDWEGIKKYHTSYRIDYEIVNPILGGKGGIIKTSQQVFEERKASGKGKTFEAPWRDVGYNFCVELIEDDYVIKVGRPLNGTGSHAVGFNSTHIGICAIGDYDKEAPPARLLEVLGALILKLQELFPKIKNENVVGHWETFLKRGLVKTKEEAYRKYKTCPGKLFDIVSFRKNIL